MRLIVGLIVAVAFLATTHGDTDCGNKATETCSECEDYDIVCTRCPTSMILETDESGCETCGDNCYTCIRDASDNIRCTVCDSGYVPRNDTWACTACIDNCDTCDWTSGTSTQCTECDNYYFHNGKTGNDEACVFCVSYCTKCTIADDNTGVCSACQDGYYLTASKTCSSCPGHCQKCNSNGACTSCDENYGINPDDATDACIYRDPACSNYGDIASGGSRFECTACNSPYGFDGDDDCIDCETNCEECTIQDYQECTKCDAGYYLLNEDCPSCEANCDECDASTGCDDCTEEWGLIPEDCNSCHRCRDTRCIQCDDDEEICEVCENGYTVEDDDTCGSCPSHCSDCSWNAANSRIFCDSGACDDGYTRNSDTGQCDDCPDHCSSGCTYDSSDQVTKCSNCEARFIENDDNTVCEPCPDDCAVCLWNTTSSEAECTTCDDYFVVRGDNCWPCQDVCDTCFYNSSAGDTWCTAEANCDEGYRLNELVGECTVCTVDNCARCNNTEHCKSCKAQTGTNGYHLTANKMDCLGCGDHCVACTVNANEDDTECTTCDTYYTPNTNGRCVKCHTGCQKCTLQADGSTDCDSASDCDSGYVRISSTKQCERCTENCDDCTSTPVGTTSRYQCTTSGCEEGYGFKDSGDDDHGKCKRCPTACIDCGWDTDLGITACTNCNNTEYVLNTDTGLCDPCPDNCETCTYDEDNGETWCTQCYSYYVVDEIFGTCLECPKHCTQCSVDADTDKITCDEDGCENHYRLEEDFTCGRCPRNCLECSYDSGDYEMKCDTCYDEYALDSTASDQDDACVPCPSACYECTGSAGVTRCKDERCYEGYAKVTDGTCADCSALFANCLTCSDAYDSSDNVWCEECNAGYTLLDDLSACSSDPTPTDNCLEFVDRPYECLPDKCTGDSVYNEATHQCELRCYKCGNIFDTDYAGFEAYSTCGEDPSSKDDYETEWCPGECWVVAKFEGSNRNAEDGVHARGCVPSPGLRKTEFHENFFDDLDRYDDIEEFIPDECGTACQTTTLDGVEVTFCYNCGTGDLSNDAVLDDTSGATNVVTSLGLLFAAIALAIFW